MCLLKEEFKDSVKTDKNKIRREKGKFAAKEKERKGSNTSPIQCIGTDGKRDKKTIKKLCP